MRWPDVRHSCLGIALGDCTTSPVPIYFLLFPGSHDAVGTNANLGSLGTVLVSVRKSGGIPAGPGGIP